MKIKYEFVDSTVSELEAKESIDAVIVEDRRMEDNLLYACRKLPFFRGKNIFIRSPPSGSLFQKIIRMENQRMKDIRYIIADNVKLY